MLNHTKAKGSAVLWFILAIIPFVNLYVLWKMAVLIANHEEQ